MLKFTPYSTPFCGRCYKPRIICTCSPVIPDVESEGYDPYNHHGKYMRESKELFRDYNRVS